MNKRNALLLILLGAQVALTVYGLGVLLRSPYTGLRFDIRNGEAIVVQVDRGGPADGKINVNDKLLDVDELRISPSVFSADPDYLGTRTGLRIFWEAAKRLGGFVRIDAPVKLTVNRDGAILRVPVTPRSFPLRKAAARMLPIGLVGWLYLIIGTLTLRKKTNELSVANFINAFLLCACMTTLAAISARDIGLPFPEFRVLYAVNIVSSLGASFAFLHLLLVFPRKKQILTRLPRLAYAPYGLAGLFLILHLAGPFENTFITTYMPIIVCTAAFQASLLYSFFTERSPVNRKQIQWVVLGMSLSVVLWGGFTALPMLFGKAFVSQDLSLLFILAYPLGLAFAITKYRLMDIESIFDYTIIYGVTLLVLAGLETAFLSYVAPVAVGRGAGHPAAPLAAVLIIVFAYVPARNAVKAGVEKLFKRGSYDVNAEAEKFYLGLSVRDEHSVLEKFGAFSMKLLTAQGMVTVKMDGPGPGPAPRSYGVVDPELEGLFLREAGPLWSYLRSVGPCAFGYAAAGSLHPVGESRQAELERCLFVAFAIEGEAGDRGYLAMLLKKRNELDYSKKDAALMNAISANVSAIIKTEELEREKAGLEDRFRRQRDEIARELHDGLGNILTTIAVSAQVAERGFEKDAQNAKSLLGRIEGHSREALDFMRTGLTVLDKPDTTVHELAENMHKRYGDMLAELGIAFRAGASEEVRALKPGATAIINLLRTVQEAINNSVKHSRASRLLVDFIREGDCLGVVVSDNGRGFDPRSESAGMGLRNMKQRIEGLGGRFAVEASGKGVLVRVTAPIDISSFAPSSRAREGSYSLEGLLTASGG